MTETRQCIKCDRQLPLGMFDDNWRHKVNICKDCMKSIQKAYSKDNDRIKKRRRLNKLEHRAKELRRQLYGEEKI